VKIRAMENTHYQAARVVANMSGSVSFHLGYRACPNRALQPGQLES
jgi:hypothetical protein